LKNKNSSFYTDFSNTTNLKNQDVSIKIVNNTYNNIKQINSQAVKVAYLAYPDTNDMKNIINFSKQMHKNFKKDICLTCFNQLEFLQNLKLKISLAIQEIKIILKKPVRKSELIEYFSDKINNVNLIKLNLENIREIVILQKEFDCPESEKLKNYYDDSLKAANNLVEAIQNSIRKHNLNISFLIIS